MEQSGGSILTLTFQAANRVFPGYNIMGTAKAALENEVKQLASDLGQGGNPSEVYPSLSEEQIAEIEDYENSFLKAA